jgi:hypothetical protein
MSFYSELTKVPTNLRENRREGTTKDGQSRETGSNGHTEQYFFSNMLDKIFK